MRTIKQKLRKISAWVLAVALLGGSFDGSLMAEAAETVENNAAILSFVDISGEIKTQTLEVGAKQSEIRLPDELIVALELTAGTSSDVGSEEEVVGNDSINELEQQTEEQESVTEDVETETGKQEESQEKQSEPQSEGGGTETADTKQSESSTETKITETETEEPETVPPQSEAAETQAETAIVLQEEPSGQEGQSAGAEAPAVETGAAVLQAEPPAEPEPPVTEGQKAPEAADTEQTVTETGEDGGILISLLDCVFPSMTVHAAETESRTITLTDITWKIEENQSSGGSFQSETAATYIYVPELPDTVTIDGAEYTLGLGEGVELPEITVTIADNTDGYGTVIYKGTTGDCTWTLYDTDGDGTEDLLVIGGTGAMPDYYGSGYIPWNDYRENIKKVVVEEGVTGLGMYTFYCCTNLKDVSLPSTLVIIREAAFCGCESLSSLVIPSGVTEIGTGAFEDCNSLVSVMLPDTLKSIGQFAFFQCGLVEIEIPEGVETIGYRAFCQCYSLQRVILPDTLISIGEEAFSGDSNLTTIVPEGVQTIGNYAFSDAKAVYNLSDCTINAGSSTTKVNHDKITLVENGESSVQRVLPAKYVAGSGYEGTKYDASYYYSSNEGITAWYVQNGENYEKVTSGTSFQNTPTFYYAKAFDDTTVEISAVGESGDSYTLEVKDKETEETLEEGTHYTQEVTESTDWEETDAGSLTKTVTVTVTGIAGGGYVGTMETTFQNSAEAEASVTADGSTTKYPAFEDAWEAAQGKAAEVTLLADVEVSETLTVTSGSSITLKSETDGNGGAYTISGDVYNSDSGMIDVTAGGTLTLESGTVKNGEGGNNAIAVNGGHFVMKDGSAVALADGHSGICVYSGGTVTISGGSARGYNGLAIVDGGSGTISGGTFKGIFDASDGSAAILLRRADGTLQTTLGEGKAYYEVENGTKTLITDLTTNSTGSTMLYGTVTVEDCTHSCESWADDGEKHIGNCIVCNAGMKEDHNWDESGKCTADGCTAQAEASVTVNGGKAEYYTTIEAAWQEAKEHPEGATVTLLTDAAVANPLDVSEEDNIILSMADGVTLTTSDSNGCILIVYGGRLTLESGVLDAGMDFGTDFGEGIRIYGGTFIMNGGTVSGYIGIEQFSGGALDYDGGFAFITNGTVSGTMYGFAANGGSTELTGGTFSGPGASIINTKGEISDILGSGYAYQQDGAWVNDTTVTDLTGTVTVEEAPIKSVKIEGSSTVYVKGKISLTATATLSEAYKGMDVSYQWEWLSDEWGVEGDILKQKTFELWMDSSQMVGIQTFACKVTCDGYTVTSEPFSVQVIDPDATAYTITIPKTAVAGGKAVSVGINTEEPFNLNGGTVSVSVSDGIDGDGKLTLTNTDGSGSFVTSEMYVGEKSITSFTDRIFATFTSLYDDPVSLSFKEPTETDAPAGTYEGTVTFSIDYTE